tara:strand:+ start:253 stop:711 length:459 start_codon:yes stop_codon:yes gene_type:complete
MKKISEHISFKEATNSNTGNKLEITNKPTDDIIKNMELIAEQVFEKLRKWVKAPIRVNSFYRCEKLNTALRGSLNSSHITGNAIDISSLGKKNNGQMFEYIKENLDFDQLIWEFGDDKNPRWIHVSYKNKKDNRKQALRAKYRGSNVTYYTM